MPPKRPQSSVFGDDEDVGGVRPKPSGAANAQQKRPRMTPAMVEQSQPSSSSSRPTAGRPPTPVVPAKSAIEAQLAAARARVEAQVAALRNGQQQRASPSTMPVRPPAATAGSAAPLSAPGAAVPSKQPSSGGLAIDINDIKRRVEEAKRRAQEQRSGAAAPASTAAPPAHELKPTGIHPLLMQNGSSAASAARASPGVTSGRGGFTHRFGGRGAPPAPEKVNPYLTAPVEDEAGPSAPSAGKGRSMHRGLQFNRPGRHIQAAEAQRNEAQLEALKQSIQERARRAGMQEELTGEERKIRRQPPPDVEWWDAPLLPGGSYDCVPTYPPTAEILTQAATETAKGKAKAEGSDEEDSAMFIGLPLILAAGTPIDHYVQHPIPIPAPSDKYKVEPKGVMLTKKEMKKMRRQRRAAEQQDKQDRIKMGLQAPDAPKVKLSNLMRVLTSEAVADPTKVEARVRREVAARREQHERTNAERALTDEQRLEKLNNKMEKDEAKGVYVNVYKIKHLVSGSHKFKVRKNAQQNGLTGLCLFNPAFALVVVEGPSKGIKAYRRLMTARIDWTDPGRARGSSAGAGSDDERPAPFLGAMGDEPPNKQASKEEEKMLREMDWTKNTCELIFEGPERERQVPGGFKARNAPTDLDARDILGRQWAGFWDLAKRNQAASEDV